MNGSLPAGVRTDDLEGGGARYVLPPRPLGAARHSALVPVAQGLGVVAFSLGLTTLIRFASEGGCIGLPFALITLIPLPFGLALVLRGFRIMRGRGELEVRPGSVRWRERPGWSGWRSFNRVTGLQVDACEAPAGFLPRLPRELRATGVLKISFDRGRPLLAARYYPRGFLLALGRELDRRHAWRAGLGEERPRPTPRPPPGAEPAPRPERAVPRPPPSAAPGDAGITFLPGPATEEAGLAECQVCGGAMREDLVACARCRTPHHRSCWNYVGRCSTYACGSTRSQDLREGPRAEEVLVIGPPEGGRPGRKALREWMRALAARRGWGAVRSVARKGRHCQVDFGHRGLRCRLDGWSSADGLDFELTVELDTPEARARAEAAPGGAGVRRTLRADRLALEPEGAISSPEQLGRFADACLEVADAVAGA